MTSDITVSIQTAQTRHGSTHFLLLQALSSGQSWLKRHSGRQLGGEPIMPGRHEQSHLPPTFLRGFEYCPHGFGWQGSSSITGSIGRGFLLHAVNGSPILSSIQVQVGTWFITLQTALIPHVPGYGSMHLFLWHVLFDGQSEWTISKRIHSNRQIRNWKICA